MNILLSTGKWAEIKRQVPKCAVKGKFQVPCHRLNTSSRCFQIYLHYYLASKSNCSHVDLPVLKGLMRSKVPVTTSLVLDIRRSWERACIAYYTV